MKHQIRHVEFQPDAVVIVYLTIPADLRETGLMQTHQLIIPTDTDEYEEEVQLVKGAVDYLLIDALEDLENLPPFDPTELVEEEDEDEPGEE